MDYQKQPVRISHLASAAGMPAVAPAGVAAPATVPVPSRAVLSSPAPASPRRRRREPSPQPVYTVGEEIANSVTHGIGILLSIAGLVLLIVRAASSSHAFAMLAAIVFGSSLILEYTMSTLYHAFPQGRVKRVFRTFDHSCIFILIAGSYTPFLMISLLPYGGAWMMVLIWALALVGILFATIMRDRRPGWLQPALCAAMGWFVIVRLPALVQALSAPCLALLVAGGLSYTVGLIFYALKRIPYMHSIWHLWVLGGSVCQFLAVLLYVL